MAAAAQIPVPNAEMMTQDRFRIPASANGDQRNVQIAGSSATATMPAIWSTGIPYFRSRYGIRIAVTAVENPYGSTSNANSQGALCRGSDCDVSGGEVRIAECTTLPISARAAHLRAI